MATNRSIVLLKYDKVINWFMPLILEILICGWICACCLAARCLRGKVKQNDPRSMPVRLHTGTRGRIRGHHKRWNKIKRLQTAERIPCLKWTKDRTFRLTEKKKRKDKKKDDSKYLLKRCIGNWARCGGRTRNLEIKSLTLYRLS